MSYCGRVLARNVHIEEGNADADIMLSLHKRRMGPENPQEEASTMSQNTRYEVLINRGRKAGLTTRELYSAMASRPVEGDDVLGRADCNGYVSSLNQQGQRIYRPIGGTRRP
jgi:hypothetical protein